MNPMAFRLPILGIPIYWCGIIASRTPATLSHVISSPQTLVPWFDYYTHDPAQHRQAV
jgi:hypothetical protein